MVNDKKKESCSPTMGSKGSMLWIVGITLAMFIISFIVTRDLPWKPQYEVRYEFRVRNYFKNVEGPERVMSGLSLHDSHWLYGYLQQLLINDHIAIKLKYDNTEKITLLATGSDSAAVASSAAALYQMADDTMTRFGDDLCRRLAETLRNELTLLPSTRNDSLAAFEVELHRQLEAVELKNAGGEKYLGLLNKAELPQARKTPARGWVILLSMVAAFLFSTAACFLRKRERAHEINR